MQRSKRHELSVEHAFIPMSELKNTSERNFLSRLAANRVRMQNGQILAFLFL